jgi:hypothetical protein
VRGWVGKWETDFSLFAVNLFCHFVGLSGVNTVHFGVVADLVRISI